MRTYQRQHVGGLDDPIHRREELRRERFLQQVGQQLAKLGQGNAQPPALQIPSNINPPPGGPPLPDHDHSRSGMGGNILGDPTKTVIARGIWWYQYRIGVNTAVPSAALHVIGGAAADSPKFPNATPTSTGLSVAGAATMHECVDDPVLDSDATYVLNNAASFAATVQLPNTTADPGTDIGWRLDISAKKTIAAARSIDWALIQGPSTTVASGTVALVGTTPGGAYTTHAISITPAQAAGITNFADIRIGVGSSAGPGWASDDGRISRIALVFPAAGTGGPTARFDVASSQTENNTEWRTSGGTNLIDITAAGRLTVESGGSMRFVPGAGANKLLTSDANGDLSLVAVSGDLTLAGGVWTIANNAVTYAKMQDISAASRLLGRGSAAGAGDPQEITLGSGLSMSGTTLSTTGLASSSEAYVTIGNTANLSAERALAVGSGLSLVDGGANASVTLDRAALTGDVTASAGSNVTDIAAGVVGDTEIANYTNKDHLYNDMFVQTNGTTMSFTAIGSHPNKYRGMQFVDAPASGPQAITAHWKVPEKYDPTDGLTVKIFYKMTAAGAGSPTGFKFNVNGKWLSVAGGEDPTGAADDTLGAVVPEDGSTYVNTKVATIGTLTTNDAAGKLLRLTAWRDTIDVGDDTTDTVVLIALILEWTSLR